MNRNSYPISDAELETWVEQTIQREITRGRLLQEQKSLSSEHSNKVAVLIPKPANGRTISKWNKRGQARSKSPLVKNTRLSSLVSRDDSCSSYRSPRLSRPACSMRISELAAPTKRQCMASWRANANILPEPMINRLKQRVTDQEPIVKVSDVINCSKTNRRLSDSLNSVVIAPSKRPSRKINQEAINQKMKAEYKVLSDAFGIKIAELLMKPMAITLSPQLKNLSHIISDEMYNIIKDTKAFKTDKATNKRMVQELSEKVTIWVARILDDSSEKLLEEEIRARRLVHAGDMPSLIEIITCREKELEEQEGPVLDELVDSILHKCIKTPSDILTPEFLSVTSEDIENDQQETDQQIVDGEAPYGDAVTLDEEANKDTIEDDIMKQLNNVIASAIQEDSLESPSKVSGDRSTNNEENYEGNIDMNSETVIQTEANIELDLKSETDIKPQANIEPEIYIKSDSDIKPETNIEPELNNKSESDIKPETNIEPELDIKSESDIKPETNIEPKLDIKPESDIKPGPEIDVLYSNDIPLATPDDDNDDEHNENVNGTPELSSTQILANEIDETPMIQNDNKADENIEDSNIMAPEENNVTNTDEEQTSNVSGAIEVLTEELSEGKIKTVQFYKENLDPLDDVNKEQSHPFIRKNVRLEDEQVLENIAYFERPHIDFAPPNEELLSDADESWPESSPITKPSASVTRSITSMGRILESDEVFSTAFEDDTEYLLQTTDSKTHHEDDNDEKNINILNLEGTGDLKPEDTEEMDDLQSSKDLPNGNKTGEPPDGPLNEAEIDNGSVMLSLEPLQESSSTLIRKGSSIILIGDKDLLESQLHNHTVWESNISKHSANRTQSSDHLDKGANKDRINESQIAEEFIPHKFDYRVHLKTAPAWIRRGQGEPNGISCACRPLNYSGTDKMRERELEIRKCCQDLDFILVNLDKWKTWLNYISKYITHLKRKAGKVNRSRQRSPQRTEEDISWPQLHKRAMCGLEMRRKEDTVKLKIPSAPLKYCPKCGRRKSNQSKRRHHQSNIRNNTESKCKRHYRREEPSLRRNWSFLLH